ncbi:MAG: response regulator [Actinobacteria bacterium]|nr:response regulator [Actinomycetota bacterium]
MRLLIAEDDLSIRELIALTVPDDWDVVQATDGVEAIALARRYRPDAIILDQEMPVVRGTEVCQLVQREGWRSRCTIVALTASRDPAVRREMIQAGADAFLEKPFSPVELLQLLNAWDLDHV